MNSGVIVFCFKTDSFGGQPRGLPKQMTVDIMQEYQRRGEQVKLVQQYTMACDISQPCHQLLKPSRAEHIAFLKSIICQYMSLSENRQTGR